MDENNGTVLDTERGLPILRPTNDTSLLDT
jgi:hypothetical protein